VSPASSDFELADRIVRDGDENAFDVLYERHAAAMFRFALRVVGGVRSDAEDVLQEAWIRGMESLERFERSSSLKTWLFGITLNVGRELLRRRVRAENTPSALVAELGRRRDVGVSERIDLERAVVSLPDDWRLVLLLHDIEGYTHEEIAQWLGIQTGTSRSRLCRAHARIREDLTRDQNEELIGNAEHNRAGGRTME
jgi:RNA polymerase sigma-70 factor (ECF subfamily)